MPNVRKAMRTNKPTKDDPPGTRIIKGVKSIPYVKPTATTGSSSELDTGYARARAMGGGIVPGARKVEIPPIGNPIKQIAGLFKKKKPK